MPREPRPGSDFIFFYGTLMRAFDRTARASLDRYLEFRGHGTIPAALFDLGLYPAAVPSDDGSVRGEVYTLVRADLVLPALDDIEGYRPEEPSASLYTRALAPATFDDLSVVDAWVYFYNAPLGRAPRIASGDYLEYLGRV